MLPPPHRPFEGVWLTLANKVVNAINEPELPTERVLGARPYSWRVNDRLSVPNSAARRLRRCGTATATIIWTTLGARCHADGFWSAAVVLHADFSGAALCAGTACTRVAAPGLALRLARDRPDAEA